MFGLVSRVSIHSQDKLNTDYYIHFITCVKEEFNVVFEYNQIKSIGS